MIFISGSFPSLASHCREDGLSVLVEHVELADVAAEHVEEEAEALASVEELRGEGGRDDASAVVGHERGRLHVDVVR